ncbi:MAG: GlsB/YeaQ/YmgE family stress response membrane protein [Acidobacteriota bacterium]|nr:GlsB/YeaQ/YmgE family stress response membrane protein [Acidobacteriota bacterium]
MLVTLLIWIVLGFVAGFIAKAIMPGPDGGGFIMTTILGIVGAVVGGLIGRSFFDSGASINNNDFSIMSIIFAVIGAIIVLAIYRLATGRSLRA